MIWIHDGYSTSSHQNTRKRSHRSLAPSNGMTRTSYLALTPSFFQPSHVRLPHGIWLKPSLRCTNVHLSFLEQALKNIAASISNRIKGKQHMQLQHQTNKSHKAESWQGNMEDGFNTHRYCTIFRGEGHKSMQIPRFPSKFCCEKHQRLFKRVISASHAAVFALADPIVPGC